MQLADDLYTLIKRSLQNFSNSDVDSVDLENLFNSIIFTNNLSTDNLPTLSRRDLKTQFQDFLDNLHFLIRNHLPEKQSLQNSLYGFFIENYKLVKSYDLDEAFVLRLLTVFHEKNIEH